MCAELEDRLRALGEVRPDGQPVTLVRWNAAAQPTSSVYDLHSLRVSLLTAWAEQGVGVEILMKVAGHCTAIMAIYYQKSSIRHITEVLNAAELHRWEHEPSNWEQSIKSKRLEELETAVSWNHRSGIISVIEGTGTAWVRKDNGMCPVGEAHCDEGGEEISPGRYTPVPGGSRNVSAGIKRTQFRRDKTDPPEPVFGSLPCPDFGPSESRGVPGERG